MCDYTKKINFKQKFLNESETEFAAHPFPHDGESVCKTQDTALTLDAIPGSANYGDAVHPRQNVALHPSIIRYVRIVRNVKCIQ